MWQERSRLNDFADDVWVAAVEDQKYLKEFHEEETQALDYFLKDCVKGLKHLFRRYGYSSPLFTAEHHHQAFIPYYQSEQLKVIDAETAAKIVDTLEKEPKHSGHHKEEPEEDDHEGYPDDASLKSWENQGAAECPEGVECEEDESRSSCTGSSCANPLEIEHHEPIRLDSLEDLAYVIEEEIIGGKT